MYTPNYLMLSASSTSVSQISSASVTAWSFIAAFLCLVEMTNDLVLATFRDSLFPVSQRCRFLRSSLSASVSWDILSD